MNLQQLKDNGVTYFKVENGEAKAMELFCKKPPPLENIYTFMRFPPIPCPSVADGVYEIKKFEEEYQLKNIYNEWVRCLIQITPHPDDRIEFRTILRLKQQATENHSVEVNDMVETIDFLLEKQRYTKSHIDALEDELRVIENKIFYLKNPECGQYKN